MCAATYKENNGKPAGQGNEYYVLIYLRVYSDIMNRKFCC